MVGPSKILTVSYGTFSCTLEGFDEPFGTMQAIAEYFRDLASQDRYFGAEPPTPDAEMLHRIAEREVQRRVEAQVQENGILLRQQTQGAPNASGMIAPFAMAAAPAAAVAAKTALAPEAKAQQSKAPAVEDVAEPTDVSDKLARIRAAVAKSEAQATDAPENDDAMPDTQTEADTIDLATTDAPDLSDSSIAALMAEDGAQAEDAFATSDAEDAAPVVEALTNESEAPASQLDAPLPETVQDTVAATPAFADEDDFGLFDEDDEGDTAPARAEDKSFREIAQDAPSDMEDAQPDAMAQPEEDTFEDDQLEDDQFEDLSDDDTHDRAETPATPERAAAEPSETPAETDGFEEDDFEAELQREMNDTRREIEERHSIEALRSEIRDVLGNTGLNGHSESELVEELAQIEQEVVIKHPHFNRKARKRIPGDTDQTAERLMEAAKSQLGEHDSKRRRETFEHIKVAVAATRAEEIVEGPRRRDIEQDREIDKYRAGMDTPAPLNPAMARAEATAKPKPSFPDAVDAGAESWDEVDAVDEDQAPQEAAETAAPAEETATAPVMDAPSEQIAEPGAPRPRRPAMVGERRSERPSARTPLMLVSEQRIDQAPAAASGPVRPRRVRASQTADILKTEALNSHDNDEALNAFKAFADDVDAWLLDDQIEAAAAYMTHIQKQAEFSRPELMRLVLDYNDGKEVSREDMLRAFGTLLREGRLERGNAGSFRLAPASEYDEPARQYASR